MAVCLLQVRAKHFFSREYQGRSLAWLNNNNNKHSMNKYLCFTVRGGGMYVMFIIIKNELGETSSKLFAFHFILMSSGERHESIYSQLPLCVKKGQTGLFSLGKVTALEGETLTSNWLYTEKLTLLHLEGLGKYPLLGNFLYFLYK